jgi:hypothetical protein
MNGYNNEEVIGQSPKMFHGWILIWKYPMKLDTIQNKVPFENNAELQENGETSLFN